jgi:hypothetical protein
MSGSADRSGDPSLLGARLFDDVRALVTRVRRTDRRTATSALRAAHLQCYGREPDYVIWAPSPLAGALAVGLVPLVHYDMCGLAVSPIDLEMARLVPTRLLVDVRRQIRAQVTSHRRGLPVERALPADYRLWQECYDKVLAALGSAAVDEIYWGPPERRFSAFEECVGGQLERDLPKDWFRYRDASGVNAIYDNLFIEMAARAGVPDLDAWQPFARSSRLVDRYWLRPGYIVVCDLPTTISVDDACRPHSVTAPALEWRDGWKVWATHGQLQDGH